MLEKKKHFHVWREDAVSSEKRRCSETVPVASKRRKISTMVRSSVIRCE